MRFALLLACLTSSTAFAQEGGSYRVVGGAEAPQGAWPDVAGIVLDRQYVACTGTLIAPNLVLTADHCVDPQYIGRSRATHVILDGTNWLQADDGQTVAVSDVIRHPRADIAILVLEDDAVDIAPRAIADGCIVDEYLEDGAAVQIVGYGLTSANDQFNTVLMEGTTEVVDANCTDGFMGCDRSLESGSELYAGGDGVDACSGDSGGPLFLITPIGDYLVGVTSRGPQGCRDGAIWVRPDAFVEWIEDETGVDIPLVTCNEPPEVAAEFITANPGKPERTTLTVTDAEGDTAFTWSVLQQPEHGTLDVADDGQITYTADDDYLGPDEFYVTVTDTTGYPLQSTNALVQVNVTKSGFLGCGCSTGTSPMSGLWLLGLGGLLIRRRR